ncbi:MAG: phage tail protein [Brevundimonas sp.]|uniref:phage tail protein n=1 Tax=Brevundimonas sp. TaxID=1871086 RepID=UPI003918DFCD
MALMPRRHGVTVTQVLVGAIALQVASSSIWGVVVIADDADAAAFPLNTAVLVTDTAAAIADAGQEGTFARTLQAISAAGRSIGVVVRVAEGAGELPEEIQDATDANVIAGLEVLRLAEQSVAVRPVILAAPGLDTAAVAASLAILAGRLGGFAYASAGGGTPAEIDTYRQTFGAKELMLIDGDFIAFDAVAAEEVTSFATAHAVGLRAAIDQTAEGYAKTISNVPVPGVTGIVSPRSWDLSSADTEMGLINGADVTGLIMRNGVRFWGNRTCSAEPQFAFESAVRSGQALTRMEQEQLLPFIDKPLRKSLIVDLIESLNAAGRREVRSGRLIGVEYYLADGNTPDQLAAGKLRIGRRYTPAAPLEDLGIDAVMTDEFYVDVTQAA